MFHLKEKSHDVFMNHLFGFDGMFCKQVNQFNWFQFNLSNKK